MGGSVSGDFGNTKGNALDALSDFLAIASLIPGLDTFIDLASIPVDLARGDFLSAGLDAVGIIPFIGEFADTAKLAKAANKAVDASKVASRSSTCICVLKVLYDKVTKIGERQMFCRSRFCVMKTTS